MMPKKTAWLVCDHCGSKFKYTPTPAEEGAALFDTIMRCIMHLGALFFLVYVIGYLIYLAWGYLT